MWHKHLKQRWNSTKSFLHQNYRKLGKFAGEFNRAADIGRRLFSTTMPAIEDYGGDRGRDFVQKGVTAFKAYDAFRGELMNADQKVRTHAERIGGAEIF